MASDLDLPGIRVRDADPYLYLRQGKYCCDCHAEWPCSYTEAVQDRRALLQLADQLAAALRVLSFTRSDGSICYDGARCTSEPMDIRLSPLTVWRHSAQCDASRAALALVDGARRET